MIRPDSRSPPREGEAVNRPDMTLPTSSSPQGDENARRLLAELGRQLAEEERLLEAPEFEEIAAAAEGGQDEAEKLLWEEQVARSPQLAGRAAALAAFRAAQPSTGRLLTFSARGAASPWFAWGAAAAALLVAALVVWKDSTPAPAPTAARAVAPQSNEVLFADGFESGNLGDWTSATPSG